MYRGTLRLIATCLLAVALCLFSGAAGFAQAVLASAGHVDACCPAAAPDAERETADCASPECQCLSCLTTDVEKLSLVLAGSAGAACSYHETTTVLTGGDYHSIDYPPEAV